MKRRSLLLSPTLFAPALAAAQGAEWRPNRAVTMVVPYAAGGGTDIVGREFAQLLSQKIGQPVVVENRGGAGGSIGTQQVVRSARPDGYTFLYAVSSNVVINPHVYRTPEREDPARVLIPAGILANYQYILVANPRFPATNLQELIALARQKPGEITFSHSGTGGNNHLAGKLLARMAGIDLSDVAYRGTAPALMDVVARNITLNVSSPPPAITLVREGRLKALAVTGPARMPALPEVPALSEVIPNLVIQGWHGIFAPGGTPAAMLDRLEAAAKRVIATAHFRARLASDGLEPPPDLPRAAFAAAVREESAYWARKVPQLGISLD